MTLQVGKGFVLSQIETEESDFGTKWVQILLLSLTLIGHHCLRKMTNDLPAAVLRGGGILPSPRPSCPDCAHAGPASEPRALLS